MPPDRAVRPNNYDGIDVADQHLAEHLPGALRSATPFSGRQRRHPAARRCISAWRARMARTPERSFPALRAPRWPRMNPSDKRATRSFLAGLPCRPRNTGWQNSYGVTGLARLIRAHEGKACGSAKMSRRRIRCWKAMGKQSRHSGCPVISKRRLDISGLSDHHHSILYDGPSYLAYRCPKVIAGLHWPLLFCIALDSPPGQVQAGLISDRPGSHAYRAGENPVSRQ
jgi:hypothetical protein